MKSKDDAQGELDDKPVPVVLGPNHDMWLLDHHHLLSALDFSGFDDLSVTVNVVCAFDPNESMEQFWVKCKLFMAYIHTIDPLDRRTRYH